MKKVICYAFFLGLGLSEALTASIHWQSQSRLEVEKRIKVSKKPILVFGTWSSCGPCLMLKREALSDPRVEALTLKFDAVIAQSDDPAGLSWQDHYNINSYPTLLVLSPWGKELGRQVGSQSAETTLAFLEEALKHYTKGGESEALTKVPKLVQDLGIKTAEEWRLLFARGLGQGIKDALQLSVLNELEQKLPLSLKDLHLELWYLKAKAGAKFDSAESLRFIAQLNTLKSEPHLCRSYAAQLRFTIPDLGPYLDPGTKVPFSTAYESLVDQCQAIYEKSGHLGSEYFGLYRSKLSAGILVGPQEKAKLRLKIAEKAEAIFQRVPEPLDQELLSDLIYLLVDLGEPKEALALGQKALASNQPIKSFYYSRLAKIYTDLKDQPQALEMRKLAFEHALGPVSKWMFGSSWLQATIGDAKKSAAEAAPALKAVLAEELAHSNRKRRNHHFARLSKLINEHYRSPEDLKALAQIKAALLKDLPRDPYLDYAVENLGQVSSISENGQQIVRITAAQKRDEMLHLSLSNFADWRTYEANKVQTSGRPIKAFLQPEGQDEKIAIPFGTNTPAKTFRLATEPFSGYEGQYELQLKLPEDTKKAGWITIEWTACNGDLCQPGKSTLAYLKNDNQTDFLTFYPR